MDFFNLVKGKKRKPKKELTISEMLAEGRAEKEQEKLATKDFAQELETLQKPTPYSQIQNPEKPKQDVSIAEKSLNRDSAFADIQKELDSSLPWQATGFDPRNRMPFPRATYKRVVNKKLTILLIENTAEVAKHHDKLVQITQSIAPNSCISVINYGSTVRRSEIFEKLVFKDAFLLNEEDIGSKACLFDALEELHEFILKEYMQIREKEFEKIKIDNVEIIGFGTGKDDKSKTTKYRALECFQTVASQTGATTKYFCLTEDAFVNVAEIGFHSIGAILRDYQS